MANEDGSLWIVLDGRIYNSLEILEDLRALGHQFVTTTNAEVILHAYEEWGADCLHRFNGMWAFAIWDERHRTLFCARDRLGIKPFYCTVVEGSFLFASEIKALLAHPAAGRRPDDQMLLAFLAWGDADHTERTMYDGIFQIPPAHSLVVSAGGPGKPERYWSLTMNTALRGADDGVAAGRVRTLLTDAVRLRFPRDVPAGTCLSGGIDSSTIAFLVDELLRAGPRRPAKTFSVCFDDPGSTRAGISMTRSRRRML